MQDEPARSNLVKPVFSQKCTFSDILCINFYQWQYFNNAWWNVCLHSFQKSALSPWATTRPFIHHMLLKDCILVQIHVSFLCLPTYTCLLLKSRRAARSRFARGNDLYREICLVQEWWSDSPVCSEYRPSPDFVILQNWGTWKSRQWTLGNVLISKLCQDLLNLSNLSSKSNAKSLPKHPTTTDSKLRSARMWPGISNAPESWLSCSRRSRFFSSLQQLLPLKGLSKYSSRVMWSALGHRSILLHRDFISEKSLLNIPVMRWSSIGGSTF